MTYKAKNHEPTNGDYIDYKLVRTLAKDGWTNREIADALDISVRTFYRKQAVDPKFKEAVKDWKLGANERAERSLHEQVCGYNYTELKEVLDADGKVLETVRLTKHQPPNSTATVFFLKNRMPNEYRDRRETEIDITPNSPVLVVPAGIPLEVWEDEQES